ncbi:S1 family peptidase [Amycolatopsis aidingensis]|uniref:S1 family peptidase n=1 Tax=Amycolatopsis aidingensis TaxID=2842453 RepID=UPI001C0BF7CA|nr:S1 family peptidase [Amycolatopsis aidingensis]
MRTRTTIAAAALALGVLAPGTAVAEQVHGYTAEVRQTAVSAIAASEGLPAAAATRILRTQDGSIRTLERITGRLGARQAGGYLDAAGRPVVNVRTSAAAERVAAAGAEPRLVAHTSGELAVARRALEALPAVAHTALGVDPRANQVVLTVADAAEGSRLLRLLDTARTLGPLVRIERVAGSMRQAVYNGDAITGGGARCSVGFNANRDGTNYIVDAGHCTSAVSSWNVGPSVDASFPGDDYGLIRNTTGHAPGAVTLWDGSAQRISSADDAVVGQRICKSGSTTGLTCGTVQRIGVTVNYAEGAVRDLVQTSATVRPGDSGGCLFAGSTGLGITSGTGGGSSFFQPVTEALRTYGLRLN